ncbi:flagellar assembly protein T N-terminal domain-containing protein [Alteromonas gracilis]|uniref:flagellar assembly protein T N-terminal domain-containing protein n=1 Tax=Alteromonas gracilis TaxID=1479524 RepID=UPI0030D58BB0
MFRFLFLSLFSLYLGMAHSANWIEGSSSVEISNAPLDAVREIAIKNAIADATFKGGAMVSSQDIVLNGLLIGSKVILQSQGVIRRAEVTREVIDNNILTVNVRVDVFQSFSCHFEKYKRNVLVTPFRIKHPSQASVGQIYDLGDHIGERFKQMLEDQTEIVKPHFVNKYLVPETLFDKTKKSELVETAQYFARQFGYQYALFGIVDEVSVFTRVKKEGFQSTNTTRRNITISVYLVDLMRQEIVHEQQYHSEADWVYGLYDVVDISSSIFWRSSFGRSVLESISNAVIDIDEKLRCSRPFAQIVSSYDDGVIVNMGENHGLHLGDLFYIHKQFEPVTNTVQPQGFIKRVEDSEMKVRELNGNTAFVVPTKINAAWAAQTFDLVSPEKPIEEMSNN